MSTTSLPVIDISPLRAPASGSALGPARDECIRALRDACHGPGFCYVARHSVPHELDAAVIEAMRRFFALSDADKARLAIASSPHFRGFTALGGELTRGAADWREQLDLGAEEEAVATPAGDPRWRRLRGPNQWPERLPELRGTILDWMAAMSTVALTVLRGLALGLGQRENLFDDYMLPRGDPHLKLMRYPPQVGVERQGEGRKGEVGQGVGMHHDSGLLSFVLQDDIGGLEVELEDRIVRAPPRPGTYVMNLGEMMQRATRGYLRATPHRVVSPPSGEARLSAAYFAHPKLESVFAPIDLSPDLAAEAPGGANADQSDPIHACFGDNYLKIRLRAHPDVAAAHYADLQHTGVRER